MEKPILFNTEMVQAILAGRKTQTRRIVKPKGRFYKENGFVVIDKINETSLLSYSSFQISDGIEERSILIEKPFKIGDVLWVREAWAEMPYGIVYRADGKKPEGWDSDDRWRPSIHMPREAARIFLKVKDVRSEHLQQITDKDAEREGVSCFYPGTDMVVPETMNFITVWDDTIKPSELDIYGWEADPIVWVIEFERLERYHAEK